MTPSVSGRRRVDVVLFDRFELLDVFGPAELFGVLPDQFELRIIGPQAGPVRSTQGPEVVATCSYADAVDPDIVLMPGGIGSRDLVADKEFLSWLAGWAENARLITSVCTGSGVLAAAGLLDGFRATSNKRAFSWAVDQSSNVQWVPTARWVEDRNRWTSSGVAAGMDMTLAIIASLHTESLATDLANRVEYDWHRDPSWDPFAAAYGLDE